VSQIEDSKAEDSKVREVIRIVLEAIAAVERRDEEALRRLYHPEVEFHWPRSLPYGGSSRGGVRDSTGPGWGGIWDPFQPTEAERRLDPRVVAASNREAAVIWRQRGINAAGERFDGEVLGLYEVRDGKFARAQMFYFDTLAALHFLASGPQTPQSKPGARSWSRSPRVTPEP
jgi:ketosteroid isomerase-like protein